MKEGGCGIALTKRGQYGYRIEYGSVRGNCLDVVGIGYVEQPVIDVGDYDIDEAPVYDADTGRFIGVLRDFV